MRNPANYKDYFYAMPERDPEHLFVPIDPLDGDEWQELLREFEEQVIQSLKREIKSKGYIPMD